MNQNANLPCPHCQKMISIDLEKEGNCPQCGLVIHADFRKAMWEVRGNLEDMAAKFAKRKDQERRSDL